MMTDNKRKLVEEVGELAFQYDRKYSGCAQAVLGAFRKVLGDEAIPEAVFKAGTGLCGGVANSGHACGALNAGIMIISLFAGRDEKTWDKTDKMFRTYNIGKELIQYFKQNYWGVDCRNIQEKVLGRYFYTDREEEFAAFLKAGGHEDKCPEVVRKAAEKTMEILLEQGLVKP